MLKSDNRAILTNPVLKKIKLLIVEDEIEMTQSIIQYLRQESYVCEVAHSVREAEDKVAQHEYDCILLDITLPDGSGLELLEKLQKLGKADAVIVISAKNSLDDKIKGLNLGADDYLSKPFHLAELGARISAVIRRKRFDGKNIFVVNELVIDLLGKTISINSKELQLTKKEYELILFLISNKNRVITKNAIAEHLSGDGAEVFDNFDFIYAHIKNLKKKLSDANCPDYIKTVYGIGYKFES